ncbi:hypothetical protein EVAR_74538_1 [Eumeta japonica]|uniref:Uncharacterized protein n=1 Tax=Eumeta variegata TaxID=151549 RepID=A0A4C1TEM8_EUMVA|nr:hypothetical protein EVAR_74538_1 [Eumeta japonica]
MRRRHTSARTPAPRRGPARKHSRRISGERERRKSVEQSRKRDAERRHANSRCGSPHYMFHIKKARREREGAGQLHFRACAADAPAARHFLSAASLRASLRRSSLFNLLQLLNLRPIWWRIVLKPHLKGVTPSGVRGRRVSASSLRAVSDSEPRRPQTSHLIYHD